MDRPAFAKLLHAGSRLAPTAWRHYARRQLSAHSERGGAVTSDGQPGADPDWR